MVCGQMEIGNNSLIGHVFYIFPKSFLHSSSLSALSCSGLRWIWSLSWEYWAWLWNTPWLGHQLPINLHACFWKVGGKENREPRGNPCGPWENLWEHSRQTGTWFQDQTRNLDLFIYCLCPLMVFHVVLSDMLFCSLWLHGVLMSYCTLLIILIFYLGLDPLSFVFFSLGRFSLPLSTQGCSLGT